MVVSAHRKEAPERTVRFDAMAVFRAIHVKFAVLEVSSHYLQVRGRGRMEAITPGCAEARGIGSGSLR